MKADNFILKILFYYLIFNYINIKINKFEYAIHFLDSSSLYRRILPDYSAAAQLHDLTLFLLLGAQGLLIHVLQELVEALGVLGLQQGRFPLGCASSVWLGVMPSFCM